MKIFSDDKKRLTQLRELVNSHGKISVSELGKSRFNQSVIDNVFVDDYDGDGSITKSDYLICSNWLMQGKPQDIQKYNRDRGSAPKAIKLPLNRLVPSGKYLPQSSAIQEPESQQDMMEYTSDWNEDGDVDELDGLILADWILQGKPSTSSGYNLQRMTYPEMSRIPNLVTANYTCDIGECCDDDYTGDGQLGSKDALVYYAWSSLIDWEAKPDETTEVEWYNQMAPGGFKFSPTKFPEMPCADFDIDGELTSKDALIYYAWSSRINWAAKPAGVSAGSYYADNAPPGFKFPMNHVPVCAQPPESPTETKEVDYECLGLDEMCVGADAEVTWTDFLIYYKWFMEDKCETVECYNSKKEDYPTACKIPLWLYELIGANVAEFEGVLTGEENL